MWVKRRTDPVTPLAPLDLFGATAATRQRHPIPGFPPEACTPQLGVPGPWFERLPHFRMDHTPSSGDELQSEYFVGREHAIEAFLALHSIREEIAPLIQVSEIRSIAEDDLFLSPATGRPSIAFHFTWRPDWPSVRDLLPMIERALGPFDPRPHWGKLFTLPPDTRARGTHGCRTSWSWPSNPTRRYVPQRLRGPLSVREEPERVGGETDVYSGSARRPSRN